jgi:hypothetical protein
MKLRPLKQFYCDVCGELIESPDEGYLQWLKGPATEEGYEIFGFRVVHHFPHSPKSAHNPDGCYYPQGAPVADLDLPHFMGPDGLVCLLDLLTHRQPPKDIQEFLEIIRRLHIPYYEEARKYRQKAVEEGFYDGANEVWPYLQDTLKAIIERYSGEE